jgi:histidinol-phosphatase (PHP family)
MSELRERGFDYVVGSVHHVAERSIDGPVESFEDVMTELGGLEALSVAYYDSIGSMVSQFEPDVVGHFDLIRKNGRHFGDVDTPAARAAASQALEVISESGAILDLNSAGYRKGLETPYPAPHFVLEAHNMGIPFCFGDDSHGPADVGRDLGRSRAYLLGLGVTTITSLDRSEAGIARTRIAL